MPEDIRRQKPLEDGGEETWTVRPDPGAALDLNEENVMKVLDEIRPHLHADGGDVDSQHQSCDLGHRGVSPGCMW